MICSKCNASTIIFHIVCRHLAERAKPAGDRSWVGGQTIHRHRGRGTEADIRRTAGEQPKTDRQTDNRQTDGPLLYPILDRQRQPETSCDLLRPRCLLTSTGLPVSELPTSGLPSLPASSSQTDSRPYLRSLFPIHTNVRNAPVPSVSSVSSVSSVRYL